MVNGIQRVRKLTVCFTENQIRKHWRMVLLQLNLTLKALANSSPGFALKPWG
jgi:hypothetical protein